MPPSEKVQQIKMQNSRKSEVIPHILPHSPFYGRWREHGRKKNSKSKRKLCNSIQYPFRWKGPPEKVAKSKRDQSYSRDSLKGQKRRMPKWNGSHSYSTHSPCHCRWWQGVRENNVQKRMPNPKRSVVSLSPHMLPCRIDGKIHKRRMSNLEGSEVIPLTLPYRVAEKVQAKRMSNSGASKATLHSSSWFVGSTKRAKKKGCQIQGEAKQFHMFSLLS